MCHSAHAGFGCGEGFGDVAELNAHGWNWRNNSQPSGTTGWYQGNPSVFPAWAGEPDSYVAADADNAAGSAAIVSNWLITPEIEFGPNDFSIRIFQFYTRALPGAANRLVLRLCLQAPGEHCDAPGPLPTDVGGFDTILLDINPDLAMDGYPAEWTNYSLTPADGLPVVGRGRLAFQYYIPTQPTGEHGSYIGIDAVTMAGATVCPFTEILLSNGFDGSN